MSRGLDNLKHIVVLMMEKRSFDHLLGGLKKNNPRINGLNGDEIDADPNGTAVQAQPLAGLSRSCGSSGLPGRRIRGPTW